MLRVSKVPPGDPTTEQFVGQNRFECLTCPYQYIIDKQKYFERKNIKKKEVEDILGGKGAWDNVDKTQGTSELKIHTSKFKVKVDWEGDDDQGSPYILNLFVFFFFKANAEKYNAQTKSAETMRHTGMRCKFEVPTSP